MVMCSKEEKGGETVTANFKVLLGNLPGRCDNNIIKLSR
jgi:hypothetical protein